MPFGHKVEPALYAARGNALDEPIFKKLAGLRLPPSPECDDQTFIRRAFLDAIGCAWPRVAWSLPPHGCASAIECSSGSKP